MRLNFKLLILLGLFFISGSLLSQTNFDRPVKKIHYYTFSGAAGQEQTEALQQELAKLEFVTEAKIEYKAEKNAGQIRVLTAEPAPKQENDPQFSPIGMKRVLINLGFTPAEYRFEKQ
jgi:hypothetical protein